MNLIRIIPAKGSGQDENPGLHVQYSGRQAACPFLQGQAAFFIREMTVMDIFVNGERETSQPCSIAELVVRKGLLTDGLVVELNQRIVKHEQWQAVRLKENDEIELLSFVGGG
jgi:sulfur carrier protein